MRDRVQPAPNSARKLPRRFTTYLRHLKALPANAVSPRDSGSILRMTKFVSSFRALCAPSALAILAGVMLSLGAQCALAQSARADDGPLQPASDIAKTHFIDNDAIIKTSKAG